MLSLLLYYVVVVVVVIVVVCYRYYGINHVFVVVVVVLSLLLYRVIVLDVFVIRRRMQLSPSIVLNQITPSERNVLDHSDPYVNLLSHQDTRVERQVIIIVTAHFQQ